MGKRMSADEQMEAMDAAAFLARQELEQMVKEDPAMVKKMAAWWNKWYLKAGHKRLGRVLSKMVIPSPYNEKE